MSRINFNVIRRAMRRVDLISLDNRRVDHCCWSTDVVVIAVGFLHELVHCHKDFTAVINEPNFATCRIEACFPDAYYIPVPDSNC